jgi:hypothetical protein
VDPRRPCNASSESHYVAHQAGQGAPFVGGGDEPEQQLGAGVIERGEPEFVEDDEVVAEQVLDRLANGVVGEGAVEVSTRSAAVK